VKAPIYRWSVLFIKKCPIYKWTLPPIIIRTASDYHTHACTWYALITWHPTKPRAIAHKMSTLVNVQAVQAISTALASTLLPLLQPTQQPSTSTYNKVAKPHKCWSVRFWHSGWHSWSIFAWWEWLTSATSPATLTCGREASECMFYV